LRPTAAEATAAEATAAEALEEDIFVRKNSTTGGMGNTNLGNKKIEKLSIFFSTYEISG
jgi:hypothetical protein